MGGAAAAAAAAEGVMEAMVVAEWVPVAVCWNRSCPARARVAVSYMVGAGVGGEAERGGKRGGGGRFNFFFPADKTSVSLPPTPMVGDVALPATAEEARRSGGGGFGGAFRSDRPTVGADVGVGGSEVLELTWRVDRNLVAKLDRSTAACRAQCCGSARKCV